MSKHMLITGASSGIGNHVAKQMLKRGHRVTITGSKPNELAKEFAEFDVDRLNIVQLNMTDSAQWETVFESTLARFGELDYVFNIAGVAKPGFIQNIGFNDIDEHMDANAKGTMYSSKLAADIMIKQGHGHIINVASLAGLNPVSGMACYSASKYALRGFTLAIASDVRPHGVHVSLINPDLVRTPLMDKQLEFEEESALVFTGIKPLTVEDLDKEFMRVMKSKALECNLPFSRGLMCKLGDFFPTLNVWISSKLRLIGSAKIRKEREKKRG